MHQALGAANCSTCKLTTLQRKVPPRLTSGCVPPSFSYGTGQSLGFLFTSSVVGRRVLVLSSGWLASYVGQSEVPALITSLFFFFVMTEPSRLGFILQTFVSFLFQRCSRTVQLKVFFSLTPQTPFFCCSPFFFFFFLCFFFWIEEKSLLCCDCESFYRTKTLFEFSVFCCGFAFFENLD